jgi:predicted transcriptional regulator
MLNHLLGKLHISKSNYQAIKYIMTKLDKKKFYKLSREDRKKLYREVIRIHESNFKTYCYVMGGH